MNQNFMRSLVAPLFALTLLGGSLVEAVAQESTSSRIVPAPNLVVAKQGKVFQFTENTKWSVPEDSEVKSVLKPILNQFSVAAGFDYKLSSGAKSGDVLISLDSSLGDEEYRLSIDSDKIEITASSAKGVFYATQSIRQMLPLEIEATSQANGVEWSIAAVDIKDKPNLEYRGFMLDVSRTFMPKENVYQILDIMGMLKINTFHFHLIDDNGWRLEIKKYPKLTEIGAWRVEREKDYSARLAPTPDEPTPVGGFYTQDDMRDIVAYAKERAIDVIPEIEMPAHSMAAIASYPELACDTKGRFVGVLPGFTGLDGYTPTLCTNKDFVYQFIEDVIDEVVEIFPSKYIHIGGDEAPTVYWEECENCQKLMQQEGFTNLHDLQGYMLNRVNGYLKSKGKTMVGWDEIVESTIPEDAVVVGWRGDGFAAYKAGEQGHKYVMAPAQTMYLIRYQGPQWFEPRTYFGNNTLLDVYKYEPIKEGTSQEIASNLIGTQACLWSEFTKNPSDAQYLIFPRLFAFAENAWCSTQQRDWSSFLGRLDSVLPRLDLQGVNYARSMYNLDHSILPSGDGIGLNVSISSIRPDLEIRYSVNGAEPTASDRLFTEVLNIQAATVIKAATFLNGKKLGETLVLPIEYNKATGRSIKGEKGHLPLGLLVNGLRGSDKSSDFEWCGWYSKDGRFVVDLGAVEDVNSVLLGTIIDENLSTGLPRKVEVFGSVDGENYTSLGVKELSDEECFEESIEVKDMLFDNISAKARYVKVEFENPGALPEGRTRVGQAVWVYFDEIIVK